MKDNWERHPPVREITSDMGKPVRGQVASETNRTLNGAGIMVSLNVLDSGGRQVPSSNRNPLSEIGIEDTSGEA
jgi:hypothetical protein